MEENINYTDTTHTDYRYTDYVLKTRNNINLKRKAEALSSDDDYIETIESDKEEETEQIAEESQKH